MADDQDLSDYHKWMERADRWWADRKKRYAKKGPAPMLYLRGKRKWHISNGWLTFCGIKSGRKQSQSEPPKYGDVCVACRVAAATKKLLAGRSPLDDYLRHAGRI